MKLTHTDSYHGAIFLQLGTTLLELLVVIAIVSIISTIALTSFSSLIARDNRDNLLSELRTALHFSRIYAINHNRYITICPLSDGQCSNDWSQPISVFVDKHHIGTLDSDETLLRVLEFNHAQYLSYPRNNVTFMPDGMVYVLGSGSFIYCGSEEGVEDKRITLSQVGRIRLRDYEC